MAGSDPATALCPADEAETVAAVADALAERATLEIIGNGTKRGLGGPVRAARLLRMDGVAGISLYEPEELVLTAGPGTSLAAIEAVLGQHRQRLDFEPPDWGPLWGAPAGQQTLGGAFAANIAGPRRIKAGALRDHALGFRAVSGRAQAFKSGGRVVKNVTGFDLTKLMAGSYGTLGVLTEITLKVMPAAETEATLLLAGLDIEAAVSAMARAMGAPVDVNGAAHLPTPCARRSGVAAVSAAGHGVTALRLDGTALSVTARSQDLIALLGRTAPAGTQLLGPVESAALWREIRDVKTLLRADGQLWRLSVPPAAGALVWRRLAAIDGAEALFDWAGGLIWLSHPPADDARAGAVRGALDEGGHATLMRATDAVRDSTPVFHPQPGPLADLARRTRIAFDPEGLFNPGRMAAGA
jgi:glycolate oxidase FAD binding subunit